MLEAMLYEKEEEKGNFSILPLGGSRVAGTLMNE